MLTAGTRLPWQTPLHPHTDTPVASEQLLQPRDAADKTPFIAGALEMSCTKCQQVFRSFSRRLSHPIWVACNMSITQGHCLGGRAAHCSLRDHQQGVPVDHSAVQEVKRAKLLRGVPTRPQHAPSPPPHIECRAQPPSEQGN